MGKIETALISVSDKSGLGEFASHLAQKGIRLLASGGTGNYLREQGIECTDTATLTGSVELLGGLVKTLHPAIHAGILADRSNPAHKRELSSLGFEKIDMVVVNFYPLKEAGTRSLSFVDIGGPAMARAAAKNFASCVPVPDASWYETVLDELDSRGDIGQELRWELAKDTILRTGSYDASIYHSVASGDENAVTCDSLLLSLKKALDLKYGENPHQKAALYSLARDLDIQVVKGSLSYNNLLDIDCCYSQLGEFGGFTAVVVKHVGPCGVAQADSGVKALQYAYACDPMSAFGGVIGVNFPFDEECARLLAKRFVECIVAPAYETTAFERLMKKKKTRLITINGKIERPFLLRNSLGGVLVQTDDDILLADGLDFVSGARPYQAVYDDLIFAWKVVKHVKSNAIVFAKARRTLGIGAGQPSRVDAAKIAIRKAGEAEHGLEGSVMASDGFFPFPDCIEIAAHAGASAVIQPGGSIRDQEVIDCAKSLGLTMALTSTRHFRH